MGNWKEPQLMLYFLPELQKHLFQEQLPNRWCCCRDLNHWIISMQKSSKKRPLGIPLHPVIERQKCGFIFAKPNWYNWIIWKLWKDFLMFWGQESTSHLHSSYLNIFEIQPQTKWRVPKGWAEWPSTFPHLPPGASWVC